MARIEQVIHVNGTDGVVRECALFDSASDIPSPATAREFGLNGAKIYGAVLDEALTGENDDDWVYGNYATPLAFHDGLSASHLLTTPYYIRPKVDTVEFGADGGGLPLSDILSTNGTYVGYSCNHKGISVENGGSILDPLYVVRCAANTDTGMINFTLTLTYAFADGSTQDITFSGTQTAAAVRYTLSFDVSLYSTSDVRGTPVLQLTVNGVTESHTMSAGSSGGYTWSGEYEFGTVVEWLITCSRYDSQSGEVTMNRDRTVSVTLTPELS